MMVFIAIAMVTLLGFLAMTLDVGSGNRQRRINQTAADAAALGGGNEILRGQAAGTIIAAAQREATRNGFSTGLQVNYPPSTGPHAGDSSYVETLITKSIPTIFGAIFNVTTLNTAARAVAGVGSYTLTCLYSLDPSSAKAVEISVSGSGGGSGDLKTNCGVAINSTSDIALELNSSGSLCTNWQSSNSSCTASSSSPIAVSGGWDGNASKISPLPSIGTSPVLDPLSYLQLPSTAQPLQNVGLLAITKDTVLSPGTYRGGISITNKTTTLSPGVYIVAGGGFTILGATVKGDGVTIINTVDTVGTYTFAPIFFGNGCKANLKAPVAGDYAGIVMYGDRAGPANAVNTFACASDTGDPELTGTLYFPTQKLVFDGSNAGTLILGAVVVKNLLVSGKVIINTDTSGNSAIHRLSLVE